MDKSELLYKVLEEYNYGVLEAEEELKSLFVPYKEGSVGIAQINTVIGDVKYNAEKIIKYIKFSENTGIEVVVFPELSLSGYPVYDLVQRYPGIVEENQKCLGEIAKITNKTKAVVGFVEKYSGEYYSSLAVLSEGKIGNVVRKHLLPSFCDFNVCRHSSEYNTVKISEDLIICCSNTPIRTQKSLSRNIVMSELAKKSGSLVVYVNQTGSVDNISFDGQSCVYGKDGELLSRLKSFEEQFLIVNPKKNLLKVYPSYEKAAENSFSLNYENDLERTYKVIIQGIKDYFEKNGLKRAVLGLSGGLDSTVCAVLLSDALGRENVFGISMPSKFTSPESENDAKILAENLGINYTEMPIKNVVGSISSDLKDLFKEVQLNWDCRYKHSYTMDNIQARSRAVFLWAVSNEFNQCIPIATSDKSEVYMGYATINGDMSGGFAPVADVTKTKLFALAKWLNKNRTVKNAIPETIIKKRPSAELAINPETNKILLAEEALMPYEFLDEVIWRLENKKETFEEMSDSVFVYEKEHNISKEQKLIWLDKFFLRMARALYKYSIIPPTVLVDSLSINKNEYRMPITSARVNYKNVNTCL